MFWSWVGRDSGCHDLPNRPCSGGCGGCGASYPPETCITCPPQPCPGGYGCCEKTESSEVPTKGPKESPPPVLPSSCESKRCCHEPRKPPVRWAETISLGFQHYLVMVGTTVSTSNTLVRIMRGGNKEKAEVISTFLFIAGFNTLFQNLFGARLPVVMGSSSSSVVPTIYIACSRRFRKFTDQKQTFKHTMRAVQGAQVISSLFQIALGYSGLWKKYARALSALSKAPLVVHNGLGRIARGFPEVAKCIEVGLPELIIVVIFSQYVPPMLKLSIRKIWKRHAVIVSVGIVWVYAEILTAAGVYNNRPVETQKSCRTDCSGLINASPWFRFPCPLQWGRPTFQAGDAFTMIAASFVSTVESTGTYITTSRDARKEPMPPSAHSRALVWQGIGSLLHSIFGSGSVSSASVENAGLLGLTEVLKREATLVSAALLILSSVLGKPGAILASVPQPITAAINCINYGYAASSGIKRLRNHKKRNRSKFILGFSLFMGLSVPLYFNGFQMMSFEGPVHSDSIWFNITMQVIFSSPATVAAFVAFFFDSIIPGKATRRSKHNWRPRWKKIKKFYSLPSVDLDRINSFLKWKNLRKFLIKLLKCSDSSSDSNDDGNTTDEEGSDGPEEGSDNSSDEAAESDG